MKEKKEIVLTKKMMAVIAVIAVALIAGGITLGMNWNRLSGSSYTAKQPDLDENAVAWDKEQTSEKIGKATAKGITLPGYKSIALKADETEQSVNLFNPASNDCYFVMSLILPDKTQIWKSKMIAPGKGLHQITLDQPVKAGVYKNSVLKYECYKRNDDLTKLNGGEIDLILEVNNT